jgi:hypothetical protein
MWPSPAPTCPYTRPPTGQETGIDLGVGVPATLANGQQIVTPCLLLQSRGVSAPPAPVAARRGSHRGRQLCCWPSAAAHRRQRADSPQGSYAARAGMYLSWPRGSATWCRTTTFAKSISDAGWSVIFTIRAFMRQEPGRVHFNPSVHRQRVRGQASDRAKGPPFAGMLPKLRRQPASRPQRGAQHRAAGASQSVGGDTAFRRERSGVPHA